MENNIVPFKKKIEENSRDTKKLTLVYQVHTARYLNCYNNTTKNLQLGDRLSQKTNTHKDRHNI